MIACGTLETLLLELNSEFMKIIKTSRNTLLIACAAVIISIAFAQTAMASDHGDPEDGWYPKGSSKVYQNRVSAIKREIDVIKPQEWAGEYRYGDGIGSNVDFFIAPASGFAYRWDGCLGQYARNYGSVDWLANEVKLHFELMNDVKQFGLSPDIIPVLWGKRHYLIPEDRLIDFVNAINSGAEPCKGLCAQFLIKVGDEKRSVYGEPNIPVEFQKYLLKTPLLANVLRVGESQVDASNHPEFPIRRTGMTIDVGKQDGVFPGMEFYVTDPSKVFETARIISVGENQSEAEVIQFSLEEPVPLSSWKFSTRFIN